VGIGAKGRDEKRFIECKTECPLVLKAFPSSLPPMQKRVGVQIVIVKFTQNLGTIANVENKFFEECPAYWIAEDF
jgi:hypothetical protein